MANNDAEKLTSIPFKDFGISEETGFTSELPDSLSDYYSPWHDLASKTTDLVASLKMREETLKLPLLDTSLLKTVEELRLAQLQLCIITSGYCWERGPAGLPKSVPACVAVPLCDISDKLGVQPGMSYYCLLGNWQRIDKTKSPSRDNLKVRYVLPGGQQFVDFLIQNVQLELFFVQAYPALQNLLDGSKLNDSSRVVEGLTSLTQWVKELEILGKEYHHVMEPDMFFQNIMLFLKGFNETCGLRDGITYDGDKDRPRRKVNNPGASQSVMLQIIDHLLGVEYSVEQQKYFQQQRVSWPDNFRQFYMFIQSCPGNIREMARSGRHIELTKAFDELLAALQHFRSYNIQLVTKFVLIPNRRLQQGTSVTEPDPLAGVLSTLKGIRNFTAKSKLQ